MDLDSATRALVDRQRIVDTLHRYASSIDAHDLEGLRSVFVDDATARYGDRGVMTGADEIVGWIAGYVERQAWQHHHVSVYRVEIAGDSAHALTYHSCHQAPIEDANDVTAMFGHYDDLLRRDGDDWRIARREMHVRWRGQVSGRTAAGVEDGSG